jgi:hypothetical protein
LPVPYFHVVYTLPAPIADIAHQNKAVIYDLLFKASTETTLAIAADPKRLGARIGITAVLHTWGSAMTHHPHVHMIVPGGRLARQLPRACQRAGAPVPRQDAGDAHGCAPRRPAEVLQHARRALARLALSSGRCRISPT